MHTLHEFTLVTQAAEYVTAIVALIAFAFFWKALNKRSTRNY